MATKELTRVDLRKEFKWLYQPSARQPGEVDVPPLAFLMIDGAGDPNTPPFAEAVTALYGVAYTLKFIVRNGPRAIDYPVMPLEGLWWTTDGPPLNLDRRDTWRWTAMIMQPDYVTPELVERAREEVARKKGLPNLGALRFERFQEGPAAQIMHLGPFAAEPPTIARLHAYIAERGHRPRGKHHEIYLSDPLRTASEKLKTVLRQPYE